MLHWTPETRALVFPVRNLPDFPPPSMPTAKESWKGFSAKRRGLSTWQKVRLDPALGIGKDRFYGSLPEKPDLEADVAILNAFPGSGTADLDERWYPWLATAFGPAYGLEVLATSIRRSPTAEYRLDLKLQQALRGAFASADAATYASAAESVRDLFNKSALIGSLLAYILPNPPADLNGTVALCNEVLPVVFGLAVKNPEWLKRLGPGSALTEESLTILAQQGEAAVPYLIKQVETILTNGSRWAHPELPLRALAISDDPAVGTVMVAALSYPLAIPVIRGWITENPAVGLKLLAESEAEAAAALVKELMRTEADGFRAVFPQLSEPAQKRLSPLLARSQSVQEASLSELPALLQTVGKLPAWVSVSELPEVLLVGGKKMLPVSAQSALASVVIRGEGAQVRAALDLPSFTSFLNGLLAAFLRSEEKDKELITQFGRLVDEPGAKAFMKRVEGWASSSGGFHLAKMGLKGLALRGDSGLRLVHRISLKAKSQGIRKQAVWALESAAMTRRLTRAELEDRLVPDLELSADGSCWLDFGPRRFRVGFDEGLRPTVQEESGKTIKDLPKPAKTDDAEKSAEATERWKQLKKDVRELATLQITRLETALAEDRRWEMEPFLECLVRHPLMQHLARRLLWASYGANDSLLLFRIAEDGSFTDVDEQIIDLPLTQKLGIVHPLRLNADQLSRWGQIFADYAILQPFPQLSRPVYSLTPEEMAEKELKRFVGLTTLGGRMLGLTGKPGWQKGGAVDNGVIESVRRTIAGGGRLDVSFTPGVGIMGGYGIEEQQKLTQLTLGGTTWGALSKVVVSEVLRELEALRS